MNRRVLALGVLVTLLVLPALSSGAAPALRARAAFLSAPTFAPDAPRLDGLAAHTSIVSQSGEPSILVDKAGKWIWVGDFLGVHRSNDGGQTWTRSRPPQAPGVFSDGFALAQDAAGTLYASSTTGQWIAVDSSTDGGATWTQVNRIAAIGLPFADRPWLAVGAAAGDITLVYNGNKGEGCMRSTDGGVTFLPGSTGDVPPNAGNVVRDNFGNTYYAIESAIYMWKGPNACPVHVPGQPITYLWKELPPAGSQILTQLAVPAATGTNALGGNVYVVQPSADNGQMTVRGTQGLRMVAPSPIKTVVVSDSTMRSNTFGAIAVKPDDSEIAVSWYASPTPGDPASTSYPASAVWSVYAARITGFWNATPIVSAPQLVESGNYQGWFCMNGVSCTSGRDLSDYHGVTYGPDGKLHVVWGHESNSRIVDVRYANLG